MSSIHIAIFKWKEGVEEARVNQALAVVRELTTKVPGIREIRCGENYHLASQGFTHGVVVIGDSRDALQAYRRHPEHEKIALIIKDMALDVIGFDFDDEL